MAGGLLQLVAVGAQNQYITASPEMSYFKQVYRRYSNFAMESVKLTFLTKPVLDVGSGSFTCRIGRVADLLNEVYLSVLLPDIYSSGVYQFRWIQNLAQYMIRSYSVRIDAQLIDQGYGEWIDIWNELTMPAGKKDAYNRMTANTDDMVFPQSAKLLTIIENNRLRYNYYPEATPNTPSIPGKRIFIPLPFWFTKNPALALPLVALQYQTIDITIELRSINDLYQVYDERTDRFLSPMRYLELYSQENPRVTIHHFLKYGGTDTTTIDIDAYLECNFTFLDEVERRTIAAAPMDLLVERVYRTEYGGVKRQATIDLVIANPVKEIVWVARRNDIRNYNTWRNFTMTVPEDSYKSIMKTAKFIWNGLDRIEEKPVEYFNLVQPYQHHSNGARQGICAYSFSIYPEKWQPSGSFNASTVNSIQLYVTTENDAAFSLEYDVVVYSVYYNVFRIMGGQGGMVFAN